jgi:hypothetical protein
VAFTMRYHSSRAAKGSGLQVEADNIGGLGRKLRVGADAPRAPPVQLDAFPAQQALDRIVRGTQRCRQRSPIPTGQPLGRRQFRLAQNPQAHFRAIFGGLARPSPNAQPGQPSCRKALAPQTHRIRPHPELAANRVVPFALQAGQNNLGPFQACRLPVDPLFDAAWDKYPPTSC